MSPVFLTLPTFRTPSFIYIKSTLKFEFRVAVVVFLIQLIEDNAETSTSNVLYHQKLLVPAIFVAVNCVIPRPHGLAS